MRKKEGEGNEFKIVENSSQIVRKIKVEVEKRLNIKVKEMEQKML